MADKSVVETVWELWDLLRAYAAQETIEPLKQLGGYLKEGLLGGFLMPGGVSFLTMGVLRGVQRFDFAQFGIGSAGP